MLNTNTHAHTHTLTPHTQRFSHLEFIHKVILTERTCKNDITYMGHELLSNIIETSVNSCRTLINFQIIVNIFTDLDPLETQRKLVLLIFTQWNKYTTI